ncbi:unnamed protein product [Brassica rapa]|uniref:Uncharacterized protein n=1 Tax=Brassica campestris TaxID=3711 RepID=A0A8D9HVF9_BRACM|nr:unnamed protein product [Brassica rapa]
MARRPGGCGLTIPVSSSPLGVLAGPQRFFEARMCRYCNPSSSGCLSLVFSDRGGSLPLAVRFASPISFTFPCLACNVNVNCKLEEIVMN